MMGDKNNERDQPERIDVVQPPQRGPTLKRWQPVIGLETSELLKHLGLHEKSRNRLREEALGILSKCVPPSHPADHSTGLVVGNIQSGKTMSFTAVTALARDNGFRMVIIITGTSIPLFMQSKQRLEEDLRLNVDRDRKWQHFSNPRIECGSTIRDTLLDWDDPAVSDSERQSILITVMKNHRHLTNLIALLRSLNMDSTPTVVIDDEADQAGLNTRVNQGDESTTYRNLLALRGALPHHSFLQYTATPQAPLLINLIDVLSPQFVDVLTPGHDYTGGREFFVDLDHLGLIRSIPPQEIPSKNNPITNPPDSLCESMRLFFIGVTAGMQMDGGRGNRSMMIHPSQKTLRHAEYYSWARNIKDLWQQILELPETDPDRQQLVNEFRDAYDDLKTTVPELSNFPELVPRLSRAIRRTQVTEVNAVRGSTPVIDWRSSYAHILVGGQAMDRGFTVEGLTVTYMPRGVGVGNADTIQQRARFFGYKRPYIGYCRIFLEPVAEHAYRSYVEHEDDIRGQLMEHCSSGLPLSEWKRAFFLSSSLRPTRVTVLDLDYMRGHFRDEWFSPRRPHDSADAVETNRALASAFIGKLELTDDDGHPDRTAVQRHLAAQCKLEDIYCELLADFRVTDPTDSQRFTGGLLQLRALLESEPEAACQVFLMSPHDTRQRTLNLNDEIPNLFQGEYPVEPRSMRGSVYPGDRKVRAATGVTVQLHRIRLRTNNGDTLNDVVVPAIWFPANSARDWVVQEEQ